MQSFQTCDFIASQLQNFQERMALKILKAANFIAVEVEVHDIAQCKRGQWFEFVKGHIENLQKWEDACIWEEATIGDDVSAQVEGD